MTSGVDTLGRALTGAIAGILFAAGVSFSGGWLVSANTMQEAVADARIAALSEVCERRAQHYWTVERDRPAAKLAGWENDTRIDLAERFAPDTLEAGDLRQPVVNACNKALRPA